MIEHILKFCVEYALATLGIAAGFCIYLAVMFYEEQIKRGDK